MPLATGSARAAGSRPLRDRLLWGVRWGAYYSAVLIAWVSFVWLVRGSEPFQRQGVSWFAVVLIYAIGGPVTGVIVGILLPLASSGSGAAITGIVAAIPVSVITIATVGGFPPWTPTHTFSAILMAVLGGAMGGWMFRAVLSEDP